MAIEDWSFGNVFTYKSGAGVVINAGTRYTGQAILVEENQNSYEARRGGIPADAVPTQMVGLPYQVQLVIIGAVAAVIE